MPGIAGWVWRGRGVGARLARIGLVPSALGVRTAAAFRASAYRTGLFRRLSLPRPAVSVGNVSVGGTGKTPLASWIGAFYAQRGMRPGILLRGYGGDEGDIHRAHVPGAVVVEDPDRSHAAQRAVLAGARVLVLDDGFQHFRVRRDLDIVLFAAESVDHSPWTVPAGPWREPWSAMRRADIVIVTRKRALFAEALDTAGRIRPWLRDDCLVAVAELRVAAFEGLLTGTRFSPGALRGAKVLAVAGIADPATFGAQLALLGASVCLQARPDHYRYRQRDLIGLMKAGRNADVIVTTQKDAVKLRSTWRGSDREPLVAMLSVHWDVAGKEVERALDQTIWNDRGP